MTWFLKDSVAPGFNQPLFGANYTKANLHVVRTKAQRNNFPKSYRELSTSTTTLIYVFDLRTMYVLANNPGTETTQDSDWEVFVSGANNWNPIGTWNAVTNTPALTDASAVAQGDYYFVEGAPSGYTVNDPNLFLGSNPTVYNADYVISVGTHYIHVHPKTTWDSMLKPQSIEDYVNGTVIAHNQAINTITGLQTALNAKYDSDDLADETIAYGTVPDYALATKIFTDTHFYTKDVLYTQSEVNAKVPLTTKGDLLTYYNSAPQRFGVSAVDGRVLSLDSSQSSGLKWIDVGNVLFTGLTDTPSTYVGEGGKLVRVNATPDGLEFATATLANSATDVTATAAEVNLLDLSGLTTGWVLSADSASTASWKAPTGGGNVSNTGTPVNDQIAVWTDATTIEGTSKLTFASSLLYVKGATSGEHMIAQVGTGNKYLRISTDQTGEEAFVRAQAGNSTTGAAYFDAYGATGGEDLYIRFGVYNTAGYAFGIDNSDSDKLKLTYIADEVISPSSGTEFLTVTTTGLFTFYGKTYVDTQDAGISNIETLHQTTRDSSGTPAAGFGIGHTWKLKSSTTVGRDAAAIEVSWVVATDASRAAMVEMFAYNVAIKRTYLTYNASTDKLYLQGNLVIDSLGNIGLADGSNIATGESFGMKIGTGSTQKIAFHGSTPVAQQDITGSKGGNAALGNLLTALATLGLITDSTT